MQVISLEVPARAAVVASKASSSPAKMKPVKPSVNGRRPAQEMAYAVALDEFDDADE